MTQTRNGNAIINGTTREPQLIWQMMRRRRNNRENNFRVTSGVDGVHRNLLLAAGVAFLILLSSLAVYFTDSLTVVTLLQLATLLLVVTRAWQPRPDVGSTVDSILHIAADHDTFCRFELLTDCFVRIRQQPDVICRTLALEQIDALTPRLDDSSRGLFTFEGTEVWRLAYEQLLRSPGLHEYRSVAVVQHSGYWQDEPGRKSMALNFELQRSGRLTIQRIAIIADELWPVHETWPAERVRQWLHEQASHGIVVRFVRESSLQSEPGLVNDIGLYGSRALGTQQVDELSRTLQFTLSFDAAELRAAEERWERLVIHAESLQDYLDRYEIDR